MLVVSLLSEELDLASQIGLCSVLLSDTILFHVQFVYMAANVLLKPDQFL